MTPLFRMFIGVLLTVLFTKGCCGYTGNCHYRNCSHTITCHCGTLVLQPCSACILVGSTEVTWYYSQTENSTIELNITCTLEESKKYIKTLNCSVLKLYQYEMLAYIEVDCSLYWCDVVTHLELSEPCTVKSTSNNAAVCDSGLPVCVYDQSDLQCVAQITTTRVLSLLAQSNSTGLTGATSEPTSLPSITTVIHSQVQTPSVPSASSTPPSEIYLVVGLGALAVIVVLLVVVIIVLACISVTRGKKKMQGTEKAPEDELHTYDVVTQPMRDETGPNDQQHIYDRTQHPGIVDKTEQTQDEYCQENTTSQEYEHLHNTRQKSRREEARGRQHDYEQVSTGEQNGSKTPPSHENLYHVLDGPIEVSSSRAFSTTTADMYSTPNFSSKKQPQSPGSQDHFYHVLESPTSSAGTSMYSKSDKPTAPGKKEDDGDYDEPIFPTGNKAGHQLFDDPLYQSTFAPVMSTQSHTLPQTLPDEIKQLPNLTYASPVEDQDKMAISDSSYKISAVTSPAKPTEGKWNDMQAFCNDTQEDDYDRPAAITVKNKELNSNEGGQPVLFDDPTYQVPFAPV